MMRLIAEFMVFGNDLRQQALRQRLSARFCVLSGDDLPAEGAPVARNLVLPVPSAWPDGAPRGIDWEQLDSLLLPGCTVYGGAMGTLCAQLQAQQVRCVDLLLDSLTVTENARLTAEAALLLAMQHTQESLFALPCCVVGFGRIGQLLAFRLRALGAQVCVISQREEKRALAQALGFSALPPTAVPQVRLLFNTAPAQLLDATSLAGLPADLIWIELASGPGGLPQRQHFSFSRLPAGGLPGRLLPVSAAEVLYRAILRDLERRQES